MAGGILALSGVVMVRLCDYFVSSAKVRVVLSIYNVGIKSKGAFLYMNFAF